MSEALCFFDKLIDRRGTDCSKWDDPPGGQQAEDAIPMWTADMDFACPPPVIEAMQERLRHPIFGYYKIPARYKASIVRWHKERYGTEVAEESIIPVSSVLAGVAMAIQTLTEPGDHVMITTPGYHAFFNAVHNNARQLTESPLIRERDRFRMDLRDMEEKIVSENVRLFILCSPHNPTGRIWTEEELTEVVELCSRYGVYIVSDEIHADMTLTHPFLPLFGIKDPRARTLAISLYAPTKTFNIAGLCTAYAIVPNPALAERFQATLAASGVKVKNALGVEAMMAGYEKCAAWVDDLQEYLLKNAEFAVDYIKRNIPALHAYVPEATYFLWIGFQDTGLDQQAFVDKLSEKAHVILTRGDEFLGSGSYVRMVCACPRERLAEALRRIQRIFDSEATK